MDDVNINNINMPNQANMAVDVRAQREFLRGIPRYNLGERFDLHLERFSVLSSLYSGLGNAFMKQALYASIHNEAFKLIAPEFNPANAPYQADSFQQYSDKLSEVFEPAAEREAARIEFEQRAQIRGEHPTLFYRDKLNLFMKGYPRETRDYGYFYNRVISNLLNAEMRNYLRLQIPENLTDTNAFRQSLIKIANIVRRKYLDGELSEEQTIGAECFSTNNSYLESDQTTSGQARISAIQAKPGTKSQIGPCYYCKQMGHFKAQCARKANGLPPAVVNQVDHEVPEPDSEAVEALYANRYVKKQYPVKFVAQKKGNYTNNRRFKQRRVMFVYEQDDGQLVCEPIEDEPQRGEDPPNTPPPVERVQVVRLEEQQDDAVGSDYLPSTFLGLGI